MTDLKTLFADGILSPELRDRLLQSDRGRMLWQIFERADLRIFFQPILDLKRQEIFGYEALMRGPENTEWESPLALLDLASELGCLFELDLLARRLAIVEFHNLSQDMEKRPFLFLNISVNSLMEGHHRGGETVQCLTRTGLPVENVVIEITEHQPVHDHQSFLTALSHYRKMGFKIALDDLGGGYNGLRIWSEIHPEFVKIDKHFTSEIHKSQEKTKFMETIVHLAHSFGSRVIGEGVETEKELHALERLGVELAQGYLFKKPKPKLVKAVNFTWKVRKSVDQDVETAEFLVQQTPTVSSQEGVAVLAERFHQHPEWEYMPVVDDGQVKGMVWRRELMDLLARKYVPELLQRKTVSKIMDHYPIIVDIKTPLVELSRQITSNTESNVTQAFILTDDQAYMGCGTFSGLLKMMTDLKVRNAHYANPLSGLPGNVPIQNQVKAFLAQKEDFVVFYIDVNHFKPYNDYYSFEQGDDVITSVANILKSLSYSDEMFVGHVGGDDFMMIFPADLEYQDLCRAILDQFSKTLPQFYNNEDMGRGGILAVNRQGKQEFFPLMSLSIGVLLASPSHFQHTQQLSSFATRAKKLAKSQGGNHFEVIRSVPPEQ